MGKNRKKRDPMAPKRPISAFLEFTRDERPKILAELGPKSFGEVSRELGSRWRSLLLTIVFDIRTLNTISPIFWQLRVH